MRGETDLKETIGNCIGHNFLKDILLLGKQKIDHHSATVTWVDGTSRTVDPKKYVYEIGFSQTICVPAPVSIILSIQPDPVKHLLYLIF